MVGELTSKTCMLMSVTPTGVTSDAFEELRLPAASDRKATATTRRLSPTIVVDPTLPSVRVTEVESVAEPETSLLNAKLTVPIALSGNMVTWDVSAI